MKATDTLLIGVDGGATEVKAHATSCDDLAGPTSFELRPEAASRVYPRLADFAPVPVAAQLAERDAGDSAADAVEVEQGRLWVQAAAEAIRDVASQCAVQHILVGVGMPGLKTADGRGIDVINNGPRIPDYLDTLEKELAAAGLELLSPVAALGSDADYCGLGEQHAAQGLFRDVENAYYVGCGTGVADAIKLRGRLVPFDAVRAWIQKSWQMASALGPTFERLVSASSLNRVYADLRPAAKQAGGTARATVKRDERTARQADAFVSSYPEVAAAAGDPVAVAWLQAAAAVLAELIFERLWTVSNGRADAAHRGEAYAQLEQEHAYRGTLLDRVIIGQRVGQMYAEPAYRGVFGERLDACLASLIQACGEAALARKWLSGDGRLQGGLLVPSKLRAAPALGAAVAAVQALGGTAG